MFQNPFYVWKALRIQLNLKKFESIYHILILFSKVFSKLKNDKNGQRRQIFVFSKGRETNDPLIHAFACISNLSTLLWCFMDLLHILTIKMLGSRTDSNLEVLNK